MRLTSLKTVSLPSSIDLTINLHMMPTSAHVAELSAPPESGRKNPGSLKKLEISEMTKSCVP